MALKGRRVSLLQYLHLNVLPELEQRSLHDVSELEGLGLHVKAVAGDLLQPLPVAIQHGLVSHHLQQRAGLIEVIDPLLQVIEGLPLFESFREFATPANEGSSHTSNRAEEISCTNVLVCTYIVYMYKYNLYMIYAKRYAFETYTYVHQYI